ncbi:hypothetical protein [uncultured Chryseobacterium sp.]|uniref:hypothetical protein n=1 Tax=uncultured Chryseobacterium sp. TaxID=259322 RepID=UPI0025DD8DDC|nr:hypothetical protein [uncultured Chryseobacterium sp.]
MKKFKWFWRINYFITIYFLLLFFMNLYNVFDFEGYSNSIIKKLDYYLSFNEKVNFIVVVFVEWLQIPVILSFLLLKKLERTFFHWLYLLILVVLAISKLVLYFISTSAVFA